MEDELEILAGAPLALLLAEDLTLLSIEELTARRAILQGEIERLKVMLDDKKGSRNAAEAVFGKTK